MASFYDVSPMVGTLYQNGFLARELQEGLDSNLAFLRQCSEETIGGHIGSSVSYAKTGRKGPVVTPLDPTTFASNLDAGLTSTAAQSEIFTVSLQQWGSFEDVDSIGTLAACYNNFQRVSRNNGVQSAQSLERLVKIQTHANYCGGNTWIRPDLGSNSTSTIHVDDVRGFEFNSVLGVDQPVGVGNPLTVFEVESINGGVTQSFQVTGVTRDGGVGSSLFPGSTQDPNTGNTISDGASGTLTLTNCNTAPVAGDALVALNAAKVFRPMNKPSTNQLEVGDVMSFSLILDGKARLEGNAVPKYDDGTYHFLHDPVVQRQLFNDPMFLQAYAAQYKSEEYQGGHIFELLGIKFICTTETYVQPATPSVGQKVPVRRSVMLGANAIIKYNFDGMDTYLAGATVDEGFRQVGGVMLVNNIAQVIRPPIDRQLRFWSLAWLWIGGFACPTDKTATSNIIPTASNASRKRVVIFETAG